MKFRDFDDLRAVYMFLERMYLRSPPLVPFSYRVLELLIRHCRLLVAYSSMDLFAAQNEENLKRLVLEEIEHFINSEYENK